MYNAWLGTEPVGYKVPLWLILLFGNLQVVAAVQHALGLAVAVTIYATLVRRGVPRGLAACAAAPVLLDANQLQIEQMIMLDVWFEALIVAGLAVLLWRSQLTLWAAAASGLLLGATATMREVGVVFIVPGAGHRAAGMLTAAGAVAEHRQALRSRGRARADGPRAQVPGDAGRPYGDHLCARRAEDPVFPIQRLLAEIREQGYTGSMNLAVARTIRRVRKESGMGPGCLMFSPGPDRGLSCGW